MKHLIATLLLSVFWLLSAEAGGGLLLYTAGGSSYVNAVQYETYSAPSAHLSNVTVKGGGQMQIQSSGIIANIPFPVASTLVAFEDAEAMIAQTEMLAAKYPQYAKLLQSVGTLWKRSLEASKAQAAADAKKKAEEDRIAAEQQKQEEDRLAKEAETQRLAKVEQEQKAKIEEEQRLARLEELKKVAMAEQQRLAEVEQESIRKEAEKQRLAQIEAEKQQKEDEIKRIAEEQRLAAQEIERQNAELAAITKKILQQDSSERTKAFVKLGVGGLILCAGIWVVVFAFLKCVDIYSKVRARWRAIRQPRDPSSEVDGSQASPRDRKMLGTGIALSFAGVVCLVLPIAWLPTIFWVISPLLFVVAIILFHMQPAAMGSQCEVGPRPILRFARLAILYCLLGLSTCAASLVLFTFGAHEPQFMRRGWNSTDIAEPAMFSAVAQLSDSGVSIPSTPSLTPPERQYVEETANLLIAKNRLWVIIQNKIEQARSPGDFAKTLSRAADMFNYWASKTASNQMTITGTTNEFVESLNRVTEIGKRMADESDAKRKEDQSSKFNSVLSAALEKFDSDAEVKQAMQQLLKAINPGEPSNRSENVHIAAANEKSERTGADTPPMSTATNTSPFVNSLGMKFVPVPGTRVLFSVWDTRVKDFSAFVEATGYDTEIDEPSRFRKSGENWKEPGFSQTGDHPVVYVTHGNAKAFCKWLTEQDRMQGKIGKEQEYRLPTDEEWSAAVGSEKYPWGNEWPPLKGAGNYDPSLGVDSYTNTSPVGSFDANKFGLFDMGGNVSEWCEGWWSSPDDNAEAYRFVRGAAWTYNNETNILSTQRLYWMPVHSCMNIFGFRCVLAQVTDRPTTSLIDLKTTQSYFGEEGFFPNVGDPLENIAKHLGVQVVDKADHSYVVGSDGFSTIMSKDCQIAVIGTNRRVEGVVVYPRLQKADKSNILSAPKDVRPLVASLLQALSHYTFKHGTNELVEAWYSDEGNIGITLRRFPAIPSIREEFYTLSFGSKAGLSLIIDNKYHCNAPSKKQ